MKKNYHNGMKAKYFDPEIDTGDSNPYEDALPTYSEAEFHSHMSAPEKFFRLDWREGSKQFRIKKLELLRETICISRPCHYQAYLAIMRKISTRYAAMSFRDPKYFLPNRPALARRHSARNLGFFGIPGTGKSTLMEGISALIPSSIVHEKYKNHQMSQTQTPIIRVVCGASGGAKALNLEILSAFNDLVGGVYSEAADGPRAQREIAGLVKTAAVGIIIVDEIQNIFQAKKYRKEALATLTRLNEKCGIPLILVGTNKAQTVIEKADHTARRACGFAVWRAMFNNDEWKKWFTDVSQYHLTNKPVTLAEWGDVIFDYSGGIPDDAIGLWATAQQLALMAKREHVVLDDMKRAMEENLYMREKTLKKHKELRAEAAEDPDGEGEEDGTEPEINDEAPDYTRVADNATTDDQEDEEEA